MLAQVEVAELDPVVIAAATDAMGFPTSRYPEPKPDPDNVRYMSAVWDCNKSCSCRHAVAALRVSSCGCWCRSNLHVRTGDAAAYVAERVRQGAQPLDAVFLDAFDGDDNVPQSLCSPGRSRWPLLLAAAAGSAHIL